MKPRKSILNPEFRYVDAASTDLAKTFARERKRLAEQKQKKAEHDAQTALKVRTIGPVK